jgi:(R)-amidase
MARALENQAFAVMVNRVGQGDDGLVFAGGSAVVDPFGDLLVEAGRDEATLRLTLDLNLLDRAREPYVYDRHQRMRLSGDVIDSGDRRDLIIGS